MDASLLDKLLWPTIFGLTRNYRQIKVSLDVDVVVFPPAKCFRSQLTR